MRKAITSVVLNTILTMVMVIVVFSVGFYIYANFMSNSNSAAALKGFDEFVEPIRQVCSEGGGITGLDIKLPLDSSWIYGVIQTRINSFGAGMPIALRKCIDSYCLCLFRTRNERNKWDLWGDGSTAAPFWHWNPPGFDLFVLFLGKVVAEWVLFLVIQLIARYVGQYITSYITGFFGCDASCTSGPQAAFSAICIPACKLGVQVASAAAGYAIAGFVEEFLKTLLLELWESIVFFNYPNNLMTTEYEDNLILKDGDFNCDLNGELNKDKDLTEDFVSALIAGGFGALEGAINGAINGLFAGGSKSGSSSTTQSITQKISSAFTDLTFKKVVKKLVKELAKATLKALAWSVTFKLEQVAAVQRYEFEIDFSSKPECNVLELLAGRMYVDPAQFVWAGKWSTPYTSYDQQAYNLEAGGLDIYECVPIKDLGDYCDSETKVLLDSDHDVYLSYRLVDPFNDPMGAIFCVYGQQEQDVDIDFLEELINMVCPLTDPICQGIAVILNFLVGDILLAGQTALKGFFTECLVPKTSSIQESEYFQYWVPYPDYYGVAGGSEAQIPLMDVKLISYPNEDYATQSACEQAVLEEWGACLYNFNQWIVARCEAEFPSNAASCAASLTSLTTFTELTREELMAHKETISFISLLDPTALALSVLNRFYLVNSENFLPVVNPEDPNSISCRDKMNTMYGLCKPGVHINPLGVLR